MDFLSLGAWHPAFYFLIVPLVALDAAIPAVPSEIFVVTTGALGATGQLNVFLAACVAGLGAWIGDTLVYYLFKRKFTRLLDRFRWGRAVHRGILRASRKGGRSSTYAAIIAGRFIPGGRTATMAAAGMANVPTRQFLLCSAIGCAMWGAWMVGLGYLTGSTTNLPFWGSAVIGVGVGLVVGTIIAAVIGFRHKWDQRHRKNEGTGAADGERHDDGSRTEQAGAEWDSAEASSAEPGDAEPRGERVSAELGAHAPPH